MNALIATCTFSSFNAVRTHDCDDEHDHIVDAIERHDEVAAETAMRQHINNAFIFKKQMLKYKHKNLMKYNALDCWHVLYERSTVGGAFLYRIVYSVFD